jgi:hypothetical protein
MTAPEPQPGPGVSARVQHEPTPYDLGITNDPEAHLIHDYDGPELHPGTPEYAAGYAEYLTGEAAAAYLENWPVPYTLTPQAEALLAEASEPEPEAEI